MIETKILNSKGQPIVLNDLEAKIAEYNQKIVNGLGYEVSITTLTAIVKKVSEQKFFQVAPADYVPVKVGNGAFASSLLTYRSFSIGDDFSSGIINTGGNSSRLAQSDAGVDSVIVKITNWAKEIGWNLMELQLANQSGNWSLIEAKEKSRKMNWDLGIQRTAFLGLKGDSTVTGLYNQSGITNNVAVITKSFKTMTEAELKIAIGLLVEAYRANCNRTAWPTHFFIPESDYNGMATMASATYPLKSVLQVLREALQETCGAGFKILPCSYGDSTYSGLGVQRYVMLNYDEDSIRMDIPVDYTPTVASTINGFSFQNAAYGQFTGVQSYRPLECLYFSY